MRSQSSIDDRSMISDKKLRLEMEDH